MLIFAEHRLWESVTIRHTCVPWNAWTALSWALSDSWCSHYKNSEAHLLANLEVELSKSSSKSLSNQHAFLSPPDALLTPSPQ